jgi:hypothetical protein
MAIDMTPYNEDKRAPANAFAGKTQRFPGSYCGKAGDFDADQAP